MAGFVATFFRQTFVLRICSKMAVELVLLWLVSLL